MAIFKCKMCGGTIEFNPGDTVGVCDSCGTKQTLPRLDDDQRANLYDRANHYRRNNEYDKAMGIYEQILNEDTTDAEAYWSLVLCRYGIEYVEDPATHKRIPTVNRAQFTSIFDDDNYKSALQYADSYQRAIYEEEANAINEIQKGILAISQQEEPFDVFICYKETDANGRRTQDSVLATDLYHQLTQEGFKVFFSRITLEDKLGTAYEPYIFAALNSAKVMVVIGTKPEYFNAVWVKNEWSRYLALVKQSGGKKVLIPAYRDMDPYDLPEEFSHLQAQDMSKLGFMQDLIRGIKKIVEADEPKTAVKETVVVGNTANVDPLLKRAFMFLEDGEWSRADDFCEQVLNQDPENAQAYLGKLMAELNVRCQEDLADCAQPFDNSNNYQKAVRFGDEKLAGELSGYIDHINDRNENTRVTGIYNNAVAAMNTAHTESEYKAAAASFKMIPGFKDADSLGEQCLERAEVCRKDAVYASAISQMNGNVVSGYEAAIRTFSTIPGWKDADEQIYACQRRIEEIKAKEEVDRLEQERQAEQARIAAEQARISAEKAAKKRKRTIAILVPSLLVCIAFVILLIIFFNANQKYNNAVELYNAGKYEEAIVAFTALDGYKDSNAQIEKCEIAIKDEKYSVAVELYNAGKYEEAIARFKALDGYKDSNAQIEKCEIAIKDENYAAAVKLYNAGKYEKAIAAFSALDGYKDSNAQIEKCEIAINDEKYDAAVELYNAGKYLKAIAAFTALDGYKDSISIINEIESKPEYYHMQLLSNASVGDMVFFGSYEQDNNTSNGKEDIEWIVLARESDRVLVISRYALDCQPYNSFITSPDRWEICGLRTWLNGTFLNTAFSMSERIMIPVVTISDKDTSEKTSDKVFLLSISEAKEYFDSDTARRCQGTAYCYAQGAKEYSNGYCNWWLRTPTGRPSYLDRAAFVDADGSVNDNSVSNEGHGVTLDYDAVRPALWIDLGDLID